MQRIDPTTNRIVAAVHVSGEACSGLASGFGSIWVPLCGDKPALVRVDAERNGIIATVPIPPAGPEGGIAAGTDSVWMVTDKNGTLNRIDPSTNRVRQRISIPPGSYNPIFSNGIVWITGVESSVLTAVDASTGEVLESVAVGPKPRFLAAGGGFVWTLNQGDGTVSRVDEKSRKVVATIKVGVPGAGGDIDYGAESVWPTVFGVPLTRIDATSNKVVRQWVGNGGDSLRFGLTQSGLPTTRKACFLESQKKRSCSTEENYRDLRSRQAQTLERGASRSSTDVRHNDQFKNRDIGEFNPIFFDLAYCVKWAEIPPLAHNFSK